MRAAGCEALGGRARARGHGPDRSCCAHLPRLSAAAPPAAPRASSAARPDVFVGIDAPAFNLGLRGALQGARHPHRAVREPAGLGLAPGAGAHHRPRPAIWCCACCPSRPSSTRATGCAPQFVGHPLADQIPLDAGPRRRPRRARAVARGHGRRAAARQPAGRGASGWARTSCAPRAWLRARRPQMHFIAPMASAPVPVRPSRAGKRKCAGSPEICSCSTGRRSRRSPRRCGASSPPERPRWRPCCSRRPMVVAYRFSALTAFLLRSLGLVKVPYFSQPNLLAGRPLVPEFLQEPVNGAALGEALLGSCPTASTCASSTRNSCKVHQHAARRSRGARRRGDPGAARWSRGRGVGVMRPQRQSPSSRRVGGARIAGVDEAGRGPLAGPVVAAAVILDPRRRIAGLAGLEALTAPQRERLAHLIRERALAWAVGWADRDEIDALNILEATLLAMRRALLRPARAPDARAGRRQPAAARSADLPLGSARPRPSSRAMRAWRRSAPPPFSPRRIAMR